MLDFANSGEYDKLAAPATGMVPALSLLQVYMSNTVALMRLNPYWAPYLPKV